jgi:hypothetical protein
VPALKPAVVAYLARMRALADELLVLCAAALGLERDFFIRHTGHATPEGAPGRDHGGVTTCPGAGLTGWLARCGQLTLYRLRRFI